MSRVLRRPMFRGGRVDSRGTGITSGLGYAKGGSVEPQATFGVGNNANRDASGREKHAFFLPAIGSGLMAAARFLPAVYRGFKAARSLNTPFSKNLGFSGRVKDLFTPKGGLSAPMADKGAGAGFRVGSFLRQNPITTTALLPQAIDKGYKAGEFAVTEGVPFAAKNIIDLLYPGPSIFKEEGPSEEEKKIKELEQQQKEKEEFEKYLAAQAKIENEKQKSKISGEEDIEANKEKYAELLGKGAKSEDISNMLLSFAGKALAPEATVKSAFAEFAEEEAKRPSKKSKVDETAAALAINEYIAGKKSKAELDRFFAETDYKKQLLSKRGKENVPANIIEAAKSFGQGYKAVDYGLQMSFGGRTNKMDASEGQTIDKVPLVVDNIDQIFIEDEAPYRAVRIIIEDGKLIRDRIN